MWPSPAKKKKKKKKKRTNRKKERTNKIEKKRNICNYIVHTFYVVKYLQLFHSLVKGDFLNGLS